MDENGFGYVKVEDGKISCYMGDSRHPNKHVFENDEYVEAITNYEKLKKTNRHLEESIKRENDDNNGLRANIGILNKALEDIDRITTHAGCMGNENCNLCPIQEILKEKSRGR
jgi:hypothetical protein